MTKPSGLPTAPGEHNAEERTIQKRPKKKKPTHLPRPGAQAAGSPAQLAAKNVRICKSCGKEGRVVSNSVGVNVWCQCGNRWPISSSPVAPPMVEQLPRGLSKQTLVEPDWELAYRETGDTPDGKIGPKSGG